MALLVEIHIPVPTPEEMEAGEREHPFVWTEKVEDFLAELHGEELEVFDDGEQDGDVYIFFVAAADERTLLQFCLAEAETTAAPFSTRGTGLGNRQPGALADPQDAEVTACCPVVHPGADALGDGVGQGLADVVIEPSVQRRRAKEVGEAVPGEPLDGRVPAHRAAERCQRARRLAATAAHLEHRRSFVQAGDGDEVREKLVRISRPHPVVELRHLGEHPTETTFIRVCHHVILLKCRRRPILGKHTDGMHRTSRPDGPHRHEVRAS